MTTEGATNRGRGGKSDDPESEEIPECESDFESLSVEFREIFFRLAGACFSEMGFRDGFSLFGFNFPGTERDFDLSEGVQRFSRWEGWLAV
jgi:hypothetical protein